MARIADEERYSFPMELNQDRCYRALRARDARFDGRFFTAVRSTGIFCRPICPAPTPKRENCVFLRCAAAAAEMGFRPCLRCRPESAPGTPAWLGTSTTVARALRLISDGALDGAGVADLAARLGVGERQLRRLFLRHLGASPVAVGQTRRVLFAKKLLDETDLPMAQVGLSAGFASIRRFNDAMRSTYGIAPRDLRKKRRRHSQAAEPDGLTLVFAYRPPYDWQAIAGFLALRAIPGVESVAAGSYRRTFRVGDCEGVLAVSPSADSHQLIAKVRFDGAAPLQQISERIRRIFDLAADPAAITAHLRRSPVLRAAATARPGIRVPGAWDGFELAVRAILGQQVSVKGATTLSGRLVERFGAPARLTADDADLHSHFPRPEVLADADIGSIGLPQARARAIATLARSVAGGRLDLETPRALEEVVADLTQLPGIGDWTAHYVAMRALNDPDAFPTSDLGLRRALAGGGRLPTAADLALWSEDWRPWRAYAAMLLWVPPAGGTTRPPSGPRVLEPPTSR